MKRLLAFGSIVALLAPLALADDKDETGEEFVIDAGAPTASASVTPPIVHAPPRLRLPQKDGMVQLPGCHFVMGARDPAAPANERPTHEENVAAFWIDKTEVTAGAYRICVAQKKCGTPQKSHSTCTFDAPIPPVGDFPINCVTWAEAEHYCHALGKRLPREAEWEFAARGTLSVKYPWGGAGTSCSFAATLLHDQTGRRCSGAMPAKVGSYPMGASGFGVLDLTGNVEEWTSDWYAEHLMAGAVPRSGSSHVLRGGGWLSPPSASRTTSRNWGSSIEAGPNVGFRCAKDL